ncbi:hypothetical protein T01_11605 [Trichinella spiralis]|uniref:Uncharacterized protein n=1 Tax=Trichinella spiralis TaxID=6334 RepID=A0A0V1AQY0_TRISP|nr:hypothetical protein T01_11605 [Trichinella spiralis]
MLMPSAFLPFFLPPNYSYNQLSQAGRPAEAQLGKNGRNNPAPGLLFKIPLCNDLLHDILFLFFFSESSRLIFSAALRLVELFQELLSLVELAFLSIPNNKVVDQCKNNHNENRVAANSQRIDSFTFVTASSLLRLMKPHVVAISVSYGKVTPSMTKQRHR